MEHDLWRQWQTFTALLPPLMTNPAGNPDAGGFAPLIDAAERFTSAARTFLGGPANAAAPADAARMFSDFLREQFADFKLPWAGSFGAAPSFAMDSPALGPNREHQQRLQRTALSLRRMDEAQRRLQRLWTDALLEAATAFAARSAGPQGAGISADTLRKLYDDWIDCAEEAYARTAHGDAFCDALTEFVNASSAWRRELQASTEVWAKQLDLPTRSEINSLNARLKALEQRVRVQRVAAPRPRAKPRKSAKPQSRPTPKDAAKRRGKATR
jgi:polyhydroxyalkanoate synthesis regulator phasin